MKPMLKIKGKTPLVIKKKPLGFLEGMKELDVYAKQILNSIGDEKQFVCPYCKEPIYITIRLNEPKPKSWTIEFDPLWRVHFHCPKGCVGHNSREVRDA